MANADRFSFSIVNKIISTVLILVLIPFNLTFAQEAVPVNQEMLVPEKTAEAMPQTGKEEPAGIPDNTLQTLIKENSNPLAKVEPKEADSPQLKEGMVQTAPQPEPMPSQSAYFDIMAAVSESLKIDPKSQSLDVRTVFRKDWAVCKGTGCPTWSYYVDVTVTSISGCNGEVDAILVSPDGTKVIYGPSDIPKHYAGVVTGGFFSEEQKPAQAHLLETYLEVEALIAITKAINVPMEHLDEVVFTQPGGKNNCQAVGCYTLNGHLKVTAGWRVYEGTLKKEWGAQPADAYRIDLVLVEPAPIKTVKTFIQNDFKNSFGVSETVFTDWVEKGKIKIEVDLFNAKTATVHIDPEVTLSLEAVLLADPLMTQMPETITYGLLEAPPPPGSCAVGSADLSCTPYVPVYNLYDANFKIGGRFYQIAYYTAKDKELPTATDNRMHRITVYEENPEIVCITAPCLAWRAIKTIFIKDPSPGEQLIKAIADINYFGADGHTISRIQTVELGERSNGTRYILGVFDKDVNGLMQIQSRFDYSTTGALTGIARYDLMHQHAALARITEITKNPADTGTYEALITVGGGYQEKVKFETIEQLLEKAKELEDLKQPILKKMGEQLAEIEIMAQKMQAMVNQAISDLSPLLQEAADAKSRMIQMANETILLIDQSGLQTPELEAIRTEAKKLLSWNTWDLRQMLFLVSNALADYTNQARTLLQKANDTSDLGTLESLSKEMIRIHDMFQVSSNSIIENFLKSMASTANYVLNATKAKEAKAQEFLNQAKKLLDETDPETLKKLVLQHLAEVMGWAPELLDGYIQKISVDQFTVTVEFIQSESMEYHMMELTRLIDVLGSNQRPIKAVYTLRPKYLEEDAGLPKLVIDRAEFIWKVPESPAGYANTTRHAFAKFWDGKIQNIQWYDKWPVPTPAWTSEKFLYWEQYTYDEKGMSVKRSHFETAGDVVNEVYVLTRLAKFKDGYFHVTEVEEKDVNGKVKISTFQYEESLIAIPCTIGACPPSWYYYALKNIARKDANGKALSNIKIWGKGYAAIELADGSKTTDPFPIQNYELLLQKAGALEEYGVAPPHTLFPGGTTVTAAVTRT